MATESGADVRHGSPFTEEQIINLPPEKLAEVREEIGDVMIYLTELAEKLGRPGRGRQSER
jgi:NTP pyrophosphatase (non-canonical NTP hydrolase)